MDEEAKTPDINQARPAASSGGVIGAAGVETQQAAADADNKPANRLENYFATGKTGNPLRRRARIHKRARRIRSDCDDRRKYCRKNKDTATRHLF